MTQLISTKTRQADLGQNRGTVMNPPGTDGEFPRAQRRNGSSPSRPQTASSGPDQKGRSIILLQAAIVAGLILGCLAGLLGSIPAAAQAGWLFNFDPSRYSPTPLFALPLLFGACGAVIGISVGALIGGAIFLARQRQRVPEARPVSRVYSTGRVKPGVS